ncbi:MAG: hypothetical protein GTN64_07470 [Candidatus Latescibacteria bacterium]|nr:hypothetical protein [Candidatus Latescibacterota bacterium]NIO78442.1 hypothetical protein [Candidatus Latescibacterota bacterium]
MRHVVSLNVVVLVDVDTPDQFAEDKGRTFESSDAGDAVREAVQKALDHFEKEGFNHRFADYTGLKVLSVDMEHARLEESE